MSCALTLFSLEGRSLLMPMRGVSLKCKGRHLCSQGVCREEQQAALPLNCPGSACLNPNPLMGITVNIPLPAKVKHTGDVQGVLGIIPRLPPTESRQGKHQLEEDTSQNWHREGDEGATWTEGTI